MAFFHKINFFLIIAAISLSGTNFTPASAQTGDGPEPEIYYSVRNDLSQPLAEMAERMNSRDAQIYGTSLPAFHIPRAMQSVSNADAVLQSQIELLNMPVALSNFEGVYNRNGVLPPDTQGDIGYDPATGKKYYVQWVNLSYQIWDVTNSNAPVSVFGPANGNTLWTGLGGPCESTNDGDPITLFDPLANRWIMSQFALPYGTSSGPYYQCIAISQSANPTGAWYRYQFQVHATKMNDYPKFGVWPDAYYMTVNQFQNRAWAGAGVYAFDRSKMLAGLPASFIYFDLANVNNNLGGMLPADLDGTTPPPAGTPGLFAEVDDSTWVGPADAIRIWEFDVNWQTPANSTFGTNSGGDIANANVYLPVADFIPMPCTYCIPQFGTTVKLDSLADRAMYRLAYRNFGDHQAMVFNHTVRADGADRAGVRWYELNNNGSGWAINQQGTYAPADGLYRWMGSIAMDNAGNMALGYSLSGSTIYPSIAATGRLNGDTAGQMTQGETILMAGGGYQNSSSSRWGDYSMMGIDPLDDCTFWYTNEYMAANSTSNWKTRISSFRYDGCGGNVNGVVQGVVTDLSTGNFLADAVVSSNGYETVSDSSGQYSLSLPEGSYTISAESYGYETQSVNNVVVTAGMTATLDFTMTALPNTLVHGIVTDGGAHGWPLYSRITFMSDNYEQTIFSDPFDGSFAINLVQGVSYQIVVDAVADGYQSESLTLAPVSVDVEQNFSLLVNEQSCQAPGYQMISGLTQTFDSGYLPTGWTVTDETGSGAIWTFNPIRANNTGGIGQFAIADSDDAGTISMTTTLVSPAVNLSSETNVSLQFKYDYFDYSSTSESANVDVSVNNGSWMNIWNKSGISDRGPKTANLDITSLAAGQENVRIRFRYANGLFSWYWQVDDVILGGSPVCVTIPGGLVAGTVTEASSGTGLLGVNIDNSAGLSTSSFSEAGDTTYDSLYFLFQPLVGGVTTQFTYRSSGMAGYPDYESLVNVPADVITRQDFVLGVAKVSVDPLSINLSLPSSTFHQVSLTVSNSGPAATNVNLQSIAAEVTGTPTKLEIPSAIVKPFKQMYSDTQSLNLGVEASYPEFYQTRLLQSWQSFQKKAWAVIPPQATGEMWISSPGSGWDGSDALFAYDPFGNWQSDRIDYSWQPDYGPADIAWDPTRVIAWTVNVDREANFCFSAVDLSRGFTGEQICPAGLAGSQRGLAYDPVGDTFFTGGWNDGMIYRFDRAGNILQSKWLQHAIAGLAYHPGSKHLYAMLNTTPTKLIVLDVTTDFTAIGEITLDNWFENYGGAGIELSTDGSLWAVDQQSGMVYQFDVGERPWFDMLAPLSWLTITPVNFTLPAGGNQIVHLDIDTTGLAPGYYFGRIQITDETPYILEDVMIQLIVDEGLLNHYYFPLVLK